MSPGGRYDGGPRGVGWGATTSLAVEPSGKLLAAGRNERPAPNNLIWNNGGGFQLHLHSGVHKVIYVHMFKISSNNSEGLW